MTETATERPQAHMELMNASMAHLARISILRDEHQTAQRAIIGPLWIGVFVLGGSLITLGTAVIRARG